MGFQKLFNELKSLNKAKDNWYSVAVICEKLKARTAENTYPARRIRDASGVIGYSVNTLNRMVSVKVFLHSMKDKIDDFAGIDFNSLSFPSLEVVKRLHQVDSEAGMAMLVNVIEGKTKHRELLENYNARMAELGGHSTGQAARKESLKFQDNALHAIKLSTRKLFGMPSEELTFEVPDPPRMADIVATQIGTYNPKQFGLLFEMLHYSEKNERYKRCKSFIERSTLYGNFFDEYWVVFPSTAQREKIDAFNEILSILDKASYGVITIPWGETNKIDLNAIKILRRPEAELPGGSSIKELFGASLKVICS